MSALQAVTIILKSGYVNAWALNEIDLNDIKRDIRRIFKTFAPDAVGLFVIDISFNVEACLGGEDHWQIQFHGMVHKVSPEEWARIRRHVRKHGGKRSLYVEDVYEPVGQLAYMAKPDFSKRVQYIDPKGSRNTRNGALTLDQELELNEWLDGYSVESRIIQIGSFGDESEK